MDGVAADDAFTGSDADYQGIETVEVTGHQTGWQEKLGATKTLSTSLPFVPRPPVLSDILRRAPGVNVRVNSRGETLASVRGSGERQLAIFLDGVPINVPWDNRFDLAQIPVDGFSGVTFLRGPSSGIYGASSSGGVLLLKPNDQLGTEIGASYGGAKDRSLALRHGGREGRFNWQFASALNGRDGLPLPTDVNAFSVDGDVITNTDRQQLSLAGRLAYQLPLGEFFTSALFSRADFGIAPEQGRADISNARFWRYPKAEHLLVAAGVENVPTMFGVLSGTLWQQSFDQIIDNYSTDTYDTVLERQLDSNQAFGARAAITKQTALGELSLESRLIHARHEQTNVRALQNDIQSGDFLEGSDIFSQTSFTLAAQYSVQLTSNANGQVGVSYDVMNPRQTGGRPSTEQFSGLGVNLGLAVDIQTDWQLQFAASRQVRLPTLRELFGEALGRFVLNPTLQPETAWLIEAGIRYSSAESRISLTPFATLTDNTLDQISFDVDGEEKRQRTNLRGSRTYGVEANWQSQLYEALAFSGAVVWSKSSRLPEVVDNSARRLYLSNRPNWLAHAELDYQLGTRTTFGLEVVHRGAAKSLQTDGQFLTLRSATTVNVAVSHSLLPANNAQGLQLTVSAENLADVFVEPQLGLPDPGRRITVGVRYSF